MSAASAFLGALAVKCAVLFLMGFGAARFLRGAPASLRHGAWAVTFAGALSLPLLTLAVPAWKVLPFPAGTSEPPTAVAPASESSAMASHLPVVPDLLADGASSAGSVPPPAPHRQTWDEGTSGSDLVGAVLHGSPFQVLLLGAWLAGAAAFLLRTAWGLATLRRIRRGAAPVRDPALREEIGRLARTLGLDPTRMHFRVSAEVGGPGTWGIVRPVVLLPPGVVGAPAAVQRSVVLHELLHVRRRAWGVQLLALVVCALNWFNPLAWRARRALLAAEEQAVDEAVVRAGVAREDYATHLLAVVRSLRLHRAPGAAAVLLAEGRSLETRLRNLLRSGDLPGPPSRTAVASVVLILGAGTATVASMEARSPMPGGAQEPVAIAAEPFLQVGVAEVQQAGDVLVSRGTLVVQGEPRRVSDILLSKTDRGMLVEAIGDPGRFEAADTIDVSDSYVHTANGISAREPFQVGAHAMYVIRTGPSQGDSARMLISSSGTEHLESSANYPEGPVHEAVGCYSVERGPWDPPASRPAQERLPVPEAVHLHWQYLLHLGREQVLAATDGDGEVPVNANVFAWAPAGGDSVRISVTEAPPGHGSVMFRLGRDGNGYRGTVSLPPHNVAGSPFPQASARLVPTSCTVR